LAVPKGHKPWEELSSLSLNFSIWPFYFSSIILQPSKETNENVSTLKKKPFGHSVKALL
jgi:hypothetical protein